jgi:hypothetical protein
MARIPIPDRGQPIDVSYISQIVTAVNELATQVSSATFRYASVDTPSGKESLAVSDLKVVAGERSVYSALTSFSPETSESFTYSFGSDEYRFPPIVTVTPVISEGTAVNQDVSVLITSVTRSAVSGVVNFNTSGNVALRLNIIAIGVPT